MCSVGFLAYAFLVVFTALKGPVSWCSCCLEHLSVTPLLLALTWVAAARVRHTVLQLLPHRRLLEESSAVRHEPSSDGSVSAR